MPTFDETLIDAYFDDELDATSRRQVEEAAQADPGLARRMDELARLRGLLANVHRPPDPPDASGVVLARIDRAEARRKALQPIAASAILAMAALLMVSLFWDRRPPRPQDGGRPQVVTDRPPAGVDARPQADPPLLAGASPEGDPVASAGSVPEAGEPGSGPEPDPDAGPGPGLLLAEAEGAGLSPDQARAAGFLGELIDLTNHDEATTLVVEAARGVSVVDLVEELDDLLRHTIRRDRRYGRWTPEAEPEAEESSKPADAFLLVASASERRILLARIGEVLGDRCRVVDLPGDEAGAGVDSIGGGVRLAGIDPKGLRLREAEQDIPRLRPLSPIDIAIRHPEHVFENEFPPRNPIIPPSLPGGLIGPRPGPGPGPGPDASAPREAPADPSVDGEGTPGVVLLRVRSGE